LATEKRFTRDFADLQLSPANNSQVSIIIDAVHNTQYDIPAMFKNISIIGDGGMGTVLAMLLCEKGIAVRMWGYDRRQLEQIEQAL